MKKRKTKSPVYYAYIIECRDGTYYTGYTKDVAARMACHNEGRGAKYVRGRGPVSLVYRKKYRSLGKALRAECAIKRLKRNEKEVLIKEYLSGNGGRSGKQNERRRDCSTERGCG